MSAPAPADPWIGRVLADRFRIVEILGTGGMAGVYLAEQLDVERRVVIKVVLRDLMTDADIVARFRREAQILARLNHPNVVQVHLQGDTPEGALWVAMEHVAGRNLAEELARVGPLPEVRLLRIGDQIAGALAAAHAAGVVHRDLKPSNVMLVDLPGISDHVKVLDFGIAKLALDPRTPTGLTLAGSLVGTPGYMAPEQIQSAAVDGRADIYALGVVLYELATGTNPFAGPTPVECLVRQLQEVPPPPSRRLPPERISRGLEAIIGRCLEKDRNARFTTAEQVQSALRSLTMPTATAVDFRPTTIQPPGGKSRTWMWAAFVLVLAASAGITAGLLLAEGEETAPEVPPQRVVVVDAGPALPRPPPAPPATASLGHPEPLMARVTPMPVVLPGEAHPSPASDGGTTVVPAAAAGGDASVPEVAAEATTAESDEADVAALDPDGARGPPTGAAVAPPGPLELLEATTFGFPLPSSARYEGQTGPMVHFTAPEPWERIADLFLGWCGLQREVMCGFHRDMDPPYFAIQGDADRLGFVMLRVEGAAGGGTEFTFFR